MCPLPEGSVQSPLRWFVFLAPLFMKFSRKEYWSGLPFSSPGDIPEPGIEPGSPALWEDSLLTELPGKPRQMLLAGANL